MDVNRVDYRFGDAGEIREDEPAPEICDPTPLLNPTESRKLRDALYYESGEVAARAERIAAVLVQDAERAVVALLLDRAESYQRDASVLRREDEKDAAVVGR